MRLYWVSSCGIGVCDVVCPHDGCNWRDEAHAQIGGLMAVNMHFRCGVL
jgi:hypothetical protein